MILFKMAVNLGREEGFASCGSDGLVVLWKVSRLLDRAVFFFCSNVKDTSFALTMGVKLDLFFMSRVHRILRLK